MTGQRRGHAAAPRQPPAGLPGLDPAWSHTIDVVGQDGVAHQWHVLDSDPAAPPTQPTLLCVHGNPTWSYLWRRLLAAAPPGWRVVAPDQLGMGYSERLAAPRRLAERVSDLDALTAAMGLTGPVVTVAHDWGGIISLGWALGHRDQVRGVVLTNTAVHQPDDTRAPALIRLAHLRVLREALCVRTPIFVRAATVLSRPPLPREVRRAFAAPYRGAARRRSVGDFVADIPFGARDASQAALEAISDGVDDLEVPALLLWGPRDPVFGEQYLRDLRARLPQADVHRYEGAAHLLPEDAPGYAVDIATWATPLGGSTGPPSSPRRPSAPEAFGASPPAE
ncbi:MAG: alpha/beta fold hydrolase, partial [Actinomycetota bacterium]|nr:alpha/beta fold hydrolase [Actinomycetota bacterium]